MNTDSEKPVNADIATKPMSFSNPKHEVMPLSSSNKSFTGPNENETNLKS